MKFATESKMKTWYQAIDLQRKMLARSDPEPKEITNADWTWMKRPYGADPESIRGASFR
jgi:hypothetical protein